MVESTPAPPAPTRFPAPPAPTTPAIISPGVTGMLILIPVEPALPPDATPPTLLPNPPPPPPPTIVSFRTSVTPAGTVQLTAPGVVNAVIVGAAVKALITPALAVIVFPSGFTQPSTPLVDVRQAIAPTPTIGSGAISIPFPLVKLTTVG